MKLTFLINGRKAAFYQDGLPDKVPTMGSAVVLRKEVETSSLLLRQSYVIWAPVHGQPKG